MLLVFSNQLLAFPWHPPLPLPPCCALLDSDLIYLSDLDHLIYTAVDLSFQEISSLAQVLAGQRLESEVPLTGMNLKISTIWLQWSRKWNFKDKIGGVDSYVLASRRRPAWLSTACSLSGCRVRSIWPYRYWYRFRYDHTDIQQTNTNTDTPFKNVYQTNNHTNICFEIHIKPIPIIGIYLYYSTISNQYQIYTNFRFYIKPIWFHVSWYGYLLSVMLV